MSRIISNLPYLNLHRWSNHTNSCVYKMEQCLALKWEDYSSQSSITDTNPEIESLETSEILAKINHNREMMSKKTNSHLYYKVYYKDVNVPFV